jgi:hypothetical protein
MIEMPESEEVGVPKLPEIMGHGVSEDENGNICLNDLWALAQKPKNRRPNDWHRGARAKALDKAVQDGIAEISRKPLKERSKSTYYTIGRGGVSKTYAHPVLALDYAEFLDPAIGVEVREIFLRYRANDIGLANDILDRIAEQLQEDKLRVHNREEIAVRNRELAAQGRRAGCSQWDYAELHNSGYRGLYNGLDADGIHQLKQLTKAQKILDHMNAAEGAANVFRVTQAKLAMQARRPKTPEEAFQITHDAGAETREAMRRIGGVMPEDMPVADSISDARKRLEVGKTLLPRD